MTETADEGYADPRLDSASLCGRNIESIMLKIHSDFSGTISVFSAAQTSVATYYWGWSYSCKKVYYSFWERVTYMTKCIINMNAYSIYWGCVVCDDAYSVE